MLFRDGEQDLLARREVLADRPDGDARAVGDLARGRSGVSLLDEVEKREHDRAASLLAPQSPPVDAVVFVVRQHASNLPFTTPPGTPLHGSDGLPEQNRNEYVVCLWVIFSKEKGKGPVLYETFFSEPPRLYPRYRGVSQFGNRSASRSVPPHRTLLPTLTGTHDFLVWALPG